MNTNVDPDGITSRCCVCARLRLDGVWQSAEAKGTTDERVSHTYCPTCLAAMNPRRRTSGRAMLVVPVPKVVPS